jgi:hypothetical protein
LLLLLLIREPANSSEEPNDSLGRANAALGFTYARMPPTVFDILPCPVVDDVDQVSVHVTENCL